MYQLAQPHKICIHYIAIIERWNKSFRPWSQNYIKPYKRTILKNCLFGGDIELQKGHCCALREIEKNKGNIQEFILQSTEQQHLNILPSKILSDTYSFDESKYTKIYQTMLGKLVGWKPGTSNALSKAPLEISYGDEQFSCKFRKYQLESMKKFIQATPGTKELKGQWSVNLADDAMMTSFADGDIVIIFKIGCFAQKLKIMYEENQCLRKNSKIRKQTLKTSCWGIEKTKSSKKFCNSIVIQENYAINLYADNVLNISPISVYVQTNKLNFLQHECMQMICGDFVNEIDLTQSPLHIEDIVINALSTKEMNELRIKYRNNLMNNGKKKESKKKQKRSKKESQSESTHTEDDNDYYPTTKALKSSQQNGSPNSLNSVGTMPQILEPVISANANHLEPIYHGFGSKSNDNLSLPTFQYVDNQSNCNWGQGMADDCVSNHSFAPPFPLINGHNNCAYDAHNNGHNHLITANLYPTFNSIPFLSTTTTTNSSQQPKVENLSEIQHLRKQNEFLMQRVADQQRQIEYLASQISSKNNSNSTTTTTVNSAYHNPLKRRRICSDIMMPPAA